MISCTDFIPAYSELFKYIEKKEGPEGVNRYWHHLADDAAQDRTLGNCAAEHGLKGVWDYFMFNLNEEAADFHAELDEEKGEMVTTMRWCPSKGKLISSPHIKPYARYCEHCEAIYRRVLAPMGYSYEMDLSRADEAYCVETIKKLK